MLGGNYRHTMLGRLASMIFSPLYFVLHHSVLKGSRAAIDLASLVSISLTRMLVWGVLDYPVSVQCYCGVFIVLLAIAWFPLEYHGRSVYSTRPTVAQYVVANAALVLLVGLAACLHLYGPTLIAKDSEPILPWNR